MKMLYGMTTVGTLVMVIALGWSVTKEITLSGWVSTQGTVVDKRYYEQQSPTIVVSYQDMQFVTHTIYATVSTSSAGIESTKQSDKVDVKYNPSDPKEGIVDGFFQKHFIALIFFSIAAVFALIGYVILGMNKKR